MARFAFQILFLVLGFGGILFADPAQIEAPPALPFKADCAATVAHLGWTPDQKWEGTVVEKFYFALNDVFPGHRFEPFQDHRPIVMKVVAKDGKILVAKTLQTNDASHREALAREAKLLATLPADHFAPAQGSHQMGSTSAATLPFFWMDYYPDGNLANHFSELGSKIPALQMLDLFKKVVIPLDILHRNGYGNGDLKPENYLVKKKAGRITGIYMTDLGSAARFDDPQGSMVFTPEYLDPYFSPGEVPWEHFTKAIKRRDMTAMQVSLQEMLLGGTIGSVQRDYRQAYLFHWGKTERTIYRLTDSPHSIDPNIHEALSALAWTPFPDTESLLAAIEAARYAIKSGDMKRFYSKSIYPVLKASLSADAIARLIVNSRELSNAFKAGKLGLSIFSSKDRSVKYHVHAMRRLWPVAFN